MLSYSTFLLLLSVILPTASAGSVQKGGNCTQANTRLVTGTYQLSGDCDSTTFCSPAGTCELRGCRKDIFPFGYNEGASLPPLCPKGQFCPDEADACQPVLPLGSACQLNRDDECEGPPNFKAVADTRFGTNVNGSVCLNFQCMWVNATAGSTCVVENTAYIEYGPNDNEFNDIVSRGNCVPGLYCDSQVLQCMQQKNIGGSCTADKECSSFNCLDNQVCGDPADAAKQFPMWVYVVVGIGIFGGMFGTLFTLFFVHRRQREQEREKRMQYWREQNAFRQNILQMRDTALASMISLPLNGGSARSTVYSRDGSEDAHLPMLQHSAPKGTSSLRHNISDEDEDQQLILEREMEQERGRPRPF